MHACVCICRCICNIYIYMRAGVCLTWLIYGFLAIQIQPCLPEAESPPSSAWVDRQLHESVRRRLHHLPHPWSSWTAEATNLFGRLWHFVARLFALYGVDGPKKDILLLKENPVGKFLTLAISATVAPSLGLETRSNTQIAAKTPQPLRE